MYLSGGVHSGSMQSMDPCGSRPPGLPTAREICVPPAPPQVSKDDYHRGMTGGRPSRGQPAGGGGGWRPGAPSVSRSWDEDEYYEDEQLPEVPDGEFLFGVNPVLAALKQRRRRMYRLLVQD